jgi:hypothetical protein
VDKRFGAQLCFVLLSSMFLNAWIKHFVMSPRPDPSRVSILYPQSAEGYSFPSGHAQGSVAFWGFCVERVRKRSFAIGAAVMIFLICLSRLYLGVHFPVDLYGGVLLGLCSLLVFFVLLFLYDNIRSKVDWHGWLVLIGISSAVVYGFFPEERFAVISGSFAGFFVGVVLEKRFLCFDTRGPWRAQVKKLVCGLAGGAVLVCTGLPVYFAYLLGGAWVGFGAPWLFKKMGWA